MVEEGLGLELGLGWEAGRSEKVKERSRSGVRASEGASSTASVPTAPPARVRVRSASN